MDLGLRDKVALVAAASKGLGRAVAEELAAEGARLVICARGQDALAETRESIIKRTGAEVRAVVNTTGPSGRRRSTSISAAPWSSPGFSSPACASESGAASSTSRRSP
jgi:NAD(P)-dependent dehydrogenase (short-subunit alcohol dehydrogenase family)